MKAGFLDFSRNYGKSSFRIDNAELLNTRIDLAGVIGTSDQDLNDLRKEILNNDNSESRKDVFTVKFEKDDNGFVKGRAVVTTIGVYPYVNKDGSVSWELRHPDDVYDYQSLRSLEMLPLTNDHPPVKVTKDNVKDFQVGHLGENVYTDTYNGFVTNNICITEGEAIAAAESGKRALSMGYSADIIDEVGKWNGVPYNKRQKNIRYNHAAIVNRGRAGDDAVMKFDRADAYQKIDENIKISNSSDTSKVSDKENNKGDYMSDRLQAVKLDSVEYKAEPEVISALEKANTRLDEMKTVSEENVQLKKDLAAMEADRDSLKEKLDAAEEAAKKSVPVAQLEGLFQKQAKIDKAVADAKVEVDLKVDAEAKMEAVVSAVFPEAKKTLEEKKDSDNYSVYLEARFDSACEQLENGNETLSNNLGALSNGKGSEVKTDSEDARWDSVINASKKKGE